MNPVKTGNKEVYRNDVVREKEEENLEVDVYIEKYKKVSRGSETNKKIRSKLTKNNLLR